MPAQGLVGVEFTGLRETATALRRLGAPDDDVAAALSAAGAIVQREAFRIMPMQSGRMARTLKVANSRSQVRVSVGNNTSVPYAYTFHAVALGKSRGGFTFRVRGHNAQRHSRRVFVRGYRASRYIPDRPFLFTAFERTKDDVYRAFVTGLGDLFDKWGRGG